MVTEFSPASSSSSCQPSEEPSVTLTASPLQAAPFSRTPAISLPSHSNTHFLPSLAAMVGLLCVPDDQVDRAPVERPVGRVGVEVVTLAVDEDALELDAA